MKQINLFKSLLIVAVLCAANIANAQIHPLSFGIGSVNTSSNWYADYVGLRFDVTAPTIIAGPKAYSFAGSGTGAWGGQITAPIVNVPVVMGTGADTTGCSAFSAGYMTGKIALEWRNHLDPAGACEFGARALNAQNAGAIAVVIINDEPGQGPVGMGPGASGASVTIPVFMIGNLDGIAMVQQYNSLPAGSVTMTITPWGAGNQNDLGFVPNGAAMWHDYAIPSNQMTSPAGQVPYNMLDGAFIANYGSNPATNVKLKATTSFTATGGLPVVQHTDSIVWEGPFYDDTLTAHNTADSIMAFFSSTEYPLAASGNGEFDVTYVVSSDSIDQYPSDNTQKVSFFTTDSLYSKGTYNFASNTPNFGQYIQFGGGIEFLWGPMYYVANGGTALSAVQFSLALNTTTAGTALTANPFVYVFKWVDGSNGLAADSIVENGELQLMGSGQYLVNGTTDTSEALLYQKIYSDTNGNDVGTQIPLDANSWYYVCVDVPAANYLGCDGSLSAYPRVYGRYNADNGMLDYSSILNTTTKDSLTTFYFNDVNFPLQGAQTRNINTVDSFVYSSMIGLIPAVAMIANNHPNSVPHVSKPLADVSLFPNPAKDQLNVTAAFGQVEKTVSYEIIDGLARFVSRDNHENVQNDTYTVNTSNLASGTYYLIISAEGRVMTRKFTVMK